MNRTWLIIAILLFSTPFAVRADISLFVLESVGVAGEFTGSGHTSMYFSNICADGPTNLRLCEPGEAGVVISSYPGLGTSSSVGWVAIPAVPYLYGVEDPANIPLYANGAIRSFLRDNYRRQRLRELVPDSADGSMPEGRWAVTLAVALNRDIYGLNLKTSLEEDTKFLKEFKASPPRGRFNLFTCNCADFSHKLLDRYFPGAPKRDFLNDLGISTPKAVARSLTRYARSRPALMFHVSKYSQVAGTIGRSSDNRNFTEKAVISKKYLAPALFFYPEIYALFAATYLATGQFDIHRTYEQYPTAGIAQLNLEQSMQKDSRKGDPQTKAVLKEIALRKEGERARQIGHYVLWKAYKSRFDKILNDAVQGGIFQDMKEVKTFFRDLELMGVPDLDESGGPILKVNSIELQLELSRRNIPYRIQSGVRFFEQAHIKDVISYLRIIVNPRDELAWKRILKMVPGIGKALANRIYEHIYSRVAGPDNAQARASAVAANERSINTTTISLPRSLMVGLVQAIPRLRSSQAWLKFVALLETLVVDEHRGQPAKQIELILSNGYEAYLQENYENADARLEDLKGLASFANRYNSTEDFLSELALLSTERFKEPQPLAGEEVVSGAEEDELLTLTSVHQAKGLEWKAVFIIWAAEGKFPSPRSLREIESEEEERRLWYVAITRAKDELYLTYPLMITDYNRQTVIQKPSRFVTECPAALFDIWNLEEEAVDFNSIDAGLPAEDRYLN